jgi:hypothetical protein
MGTVCHGASGRSTWGWKILWDDNTWNHVTLNEANKHCWFVMHGGQDECRLKAMGVRTSYRTASRRGHLVAAETEMFHKEVKKERKEERKKERKTEMFHKEVQGELGQTAMDEVDYPEGWAGCENSKDYEGDGEQAVGAEERAGGEDGTDDSEVAVQSVGASTCARGVRKAKEHCRRSTMATEPCLKSTMFAGRNCGRYWKTPPSRRRIVEHSARHTRRSGARNARLTCITGKYSARHTVRHAAAHAERLRAASCVRAHAALTAQVEGIGAHRGDGGGGEEKEIVLDGTERRSSRSEGGRAEKERDGGGDREGSDGALPPAQKRARKCVGEEGTGSGSARADKTSKRRRGEHVFGTSLQCEIPLADVILRVSLTALMGACACILGACCATDLNLN